MEVSRLFGDPLRFRLQSVRLLTGSGGERRKRRVRLRSPSGHHPCRVEVEQVVIHLSAGLRVGVDADVPLCGGAVQAVVHADVVGCRPTTARNGGRTFEVDAGGGVVVDRVVDDGHVGRLQHVDAVVAVVVGQIVGHQRAVRAVVHLDAGILVVVHDVADHRVAGTAYVYTRGPSLELAGVREGPVPANLVAGRSGRQVDAGVAVVVNGVPDDVRIVGVGEVDALGNRAAHRKAGRGDSVARHRQIGRTALEIDAVTRSAADSEAPDDDP